VVRHLAASRHGDKISDVSAASDTKIYLLYTVLYIQIYKTSSVGNLTPFLPDSKHDTLCTLINISTRSVCGPNTELRRSSIERLSEECHLVLTKISSQGFKLGDFIL
jgi:hypothetical protein